jgi:hypothetical protein
MESKLKLVLNALDVVEDELKDNKQSIMDCVKVMNEVRTRVQSYLAEHGLLDNDETTND